MIAGAGDLASPRNHQSSGRCIASVRMVILSRELQFIKVHLAADVVGGAAPDVGGEEGRKGEDARLRPRGGRGGTGGEW